MNEEATQDANQDSDVLPFIQTKEHLRFAEFCDACRTYRYIGLCYGPPGVGKSLSARHYTAWDLIQAQLHEQFYTFSRLPNADVLIANGFLSDVTARPYELLSCRSVLYTPAVANTPRQIENEVRALRMALSYLVEDAEQLQLGKRGRREHAPDRTELLIIDEADRLKTVGLEQIRDIYDRGDFGMVLIGMPGLEKRLSRYPQLSSRVGFVHQFRQLSTEETQRVLEEQWRLWGVTLQPGEWKDAEAIAAIIRITSGNFRLIQRLLTQIERIVQINALRFVTKEVVEVARERLVIGLGT
jgi:DNA transposition AAA+ family ATPase